MCEAKRKAERKKSGKIEAIQNVFKEGKVNWKNVSRQIQDSKGERIEKHIGRSKGKEREEREK